MESKVFVLSDIHLEAKNIIAKNFLLEKINDLLNLQRMNNIEPVLVLAGDVHNGTKGLPWMKEINAKVIYICGNHEFWENDYFEVITEIKNNLPDNVSFLHNDFVEIGDNIFVGGAMWTDLGKSFNPDLFNKATHIMNDSNKITYKNWYKNSDNIKKLYDTYSHDNATLMLESNSWNTIMEVEENKKTIDFFNEFGNILNIFTIIKNQQKTLHDKLSSSYEPITKEQQVLLESVLLSYKDLSLNDWLVNCKQHKIFEYTSLDKFKVSEISEYIFNKLKIMDINKKIIVVSHHLPFLEEKLIGKDDWYTDNNSKLINKLREDIYNVHYGLNYPDHNYFYRLSKGDYSKDDSILAAIHYCNNGVGNLSEKFLNNVSAWLHGHEHNYNYQDFLKNIPIVTNPLGSSMSVFVMKEDKIQLSDRYKEYHKIEDENKEIQKLVNTFLRPLKINYSNQKEKEYIVKLWVLKNFNIDKYLEQIKLLATLNKKLFTYLIKRPLIEISEYTSKEQFEINLLSNAIDFNIGIVKDYHKEINNAVALRLDTAYSFMNKKNNLINGHNITNILSQKIISYNNFELDTLGNGKLLSYFYMNLINKTFNNIHTLNNDVKKINELHKKLDLVNNTHIFNIDIKDTTILNERYGNNSYEYHDAYNKKLNEKKENLINKYKTIEINEKLEKNVKNINFNF